MLSLLSPRVELGHLVPALLRLAGVSLIGPWWLGTTSCREAIEGRWWPLGDRALAMTRRQWVTICGTLRIRGPSLEGIEPSITRVCTLKTLVFEGADP